MMPLNNYSYRFVKVKHKSLIGVTIFVIVSILNLLISPVSGQKNVTATEFVQEGLDNLAAQCKYGKAFDLFMETYGKHYETFPEYLKALHAFEKNYEYIKEHNLLYEKGSVRYSLSMNWFGDLNLNEISNDFTGYSSRTPVWTPPMNKTETNNTVRTGRALEVFRYQPIGNAPPSADLRTKNLVTPVVTQLQCAGCWAFSATAALETAAARRTGRLVSLSQQNILDCASPTKPPQPACTGGLVSNGFLFAQWNSGVSSSNDYPFEGSSNGTCRKLPIQRGTYVISYTALNTEQDMQDAIGRGGHAISVAINASERDFAFIGKGIYDNANCTANVLNHAVVVVGYGTDEMTGEDYWLIKNSWGVGWADKGFAKIVRGKNMCGIGMAMIFPNVI